MTGFPYDLFKIHVLCNSPVYLITWIFVMCPHIWTKLAHKLLHTYCHIFLYEWVALLFISIPRWKNVTCCMPLVFIFHAKMQIERAIPIRVALITTIVK